MIEKTAEAFESYFLGTILQEFAKAAQLTKKSYAEETQMSLFYEKVARYYGEERHRIERDALEVRGKGG